MKLQEESIKYVIQSLKTEVGHKYNTELWDSLPSLLTEKRPIVVMTVINYMLSKGESHFSLGNLLEKTYEKSYSDGKINITNELQRFFDFKTEISVPLTKNCLEELAIIAARDFHTSILDGRDEFDIVSEKSKFDPQLLDRVKKVEGMASEKAFQKETGDTMFHYFGIKVAEHLMELKDRGAGRLLSGAKQETFQAFMKHFSDIDYDEAKKKYGTH
jgi:hypothetical protein